MTLKSFLSAKKCLFQPGSVFLYRYLYHWPVSFTTACTVSQLYTALN